MITKYSGIVVDDHPIFRFGLVKLLTSMNYFEFIEEAENGIVLIEKFKERNFDIVFLDIQMPLMDGISAAKQLKKKYPDVKIVILTHIDNRREIIELIELGVNAYILKDTDKAEISKALMLISEGRQFFTPNVYDIWLMHITQKASDNIVIKNMHITEREIEIIKLLGKQMTAKEIGNELFISEGTVIKHKSNIMDKIGVDNIVGIILYGVKHKIITL